MAQSTDTVEDVTTETVVPRCPVGASRSLSPTDSSSSAEVRDGGLVPVAARLTQAVEGVVGVTCTLTGPPRAEDAAS
ncbi:hypothetical protein QRN89_02385 [Streptomyces chengbuensis]|uniref:hypothetical protein n=1 Tax=Streptomyces TaxID=1883 RepID=UPI0025B588A1|nr:hypothetical protein [Streptomyces sp. HUAS CB01]WJY48748.1 hypothetical protein QRN89_02385 [Streptomyces sp. HUAS CB01]